MSKYRNKIKRKQFVLETRSKLKYFVKKTVDSVEDIVKSTYTLDKTIYEHIKEGLDYGFEPRFNMYSGSIYHPSIESEYKQYHKESADDRIYEEIFDALVNTLLPTRLAKYTDLELIVAEDQEGKYFEVKFI